MSGLSRDARRLLIALLLVGLVGRIVLALSTYGVPFDIGAFPVVHNALHTDPLHLYAGERWPYPPGYFPWIVAAAHLQLWTGIALTDWVQLPSILADIAIAFIVQNVLGARGHGDRSRLVAAGLVAAGPVFVMVSGFHGQIDSIAILPAILGVLVWERHRGPRRALYAGLLIGVGGLIKTIPAVVAFALLPHMRSKRESVTLLAAAGLPLVLGFMPFALADPQSVKTAVLYRGLPGVGGISLAVQPNLGGVWLTDVPQPTNPVTVFLIDHGGAVAAPLLLATFAFVFWRKPEPIVGAALIYLSVWAFGINFFLQYLVWGIPFLLMAGYVREVAAAQLLIAPAVYLTYARPFAPGLAVDLFIVVSLGMWVTSVVGVVLLGRNAVARAPRGRARPRVSAAATAD